jgi:hypothetical protein
MKKRLIISIIVVSVLILGLIGFWAYKTGKFAGLADQIRQTQLGPGVHIQVKFGNGNPAVNYYVRFARKSTTEPIKAIAPTNTDAQGYVHLGTREYANDYQIMVTYNADASAHPCDYWDPNKYYSVTQPSTLFTVTLPCGGGTGTATPSPDQGTANITGQVTDTSGKPTPKAYVWLQKENGSRIVNANTYTDDEGKYELLGVPADSNYLVKAIALGYSEGTTAKFNLIADQTATKNIRLSIRPTNKFDLRLEIYRVGDLALLGGVKVEVWSDTNPSRIFTVTSLDKIWGGGTYGPNTNAVVTDLDCAEYNNPQGAYWNYHVKITPPDDYYGDRAIHNFDFKAPTNLIYHSSINYLFYLITDSFYPVPKFTLLGRVTDSMTGWPIEGSKIVLLDKGEADKKYSATTDEFGWYQINGIRRISQTYSITVSAADYKTHQEDFNTFSLPDAIRKDFVLEPIVTCEPCESCEGGTCPRP